MSWRTDGHTLTPDEIAASCEEAAALIEGHWTKGAWVDDEPEDGLAYCMEGALAAVLGFDPTLLSIKPTERLLLQSCPAYRAVQKTIEQRMTATFAAWNDESEWPSGESIAGWNDDYAENEQQVVDVLHETAKRVLGVPADQMRSRP